MTDRRTVMAGGAAIALLSGSGARAAPTETNGMFGLMGRMIAQPGKRSELIAAILSGSGEMPGCRSYVVAEDLENADAIWITEVWDSKESHEASLSLPQVKAAIAKGRPLVAGFDHAVTTRPVGGLGL